MLHNWKPTTWGELATLEYGKGLLGYENASGDFPVYGTNGKIGWHTEPLFNTAGVIIGRKGAYRGVHYSKTPFFVIDTAFYLKPKIEIDLRWAYYQLLTQDINSMDSGSAIPSTSRPDFYALPLLLPPLPEQRAIAGILGALDDKIELNRRMNQTLESMARAIFREQVKGTNEQGSILEFADLLSGGTPSTTEESYWNGDIEWVSAKDVGNVSGIFLLDTEKKITQAGVDNSSTKLLPAKTTIVTARGTVGAHCILGRPMTMNQTNYGLKAKESIGDYFVYFSLSEMVEQLRQQSYGTIFDTITTKTFQSALCAQPSIGVIQEFEDQVAPLMDAILNNQKESRTLGSLRDTLLPKLLSGEVSVKL